MTSRDKKREYLKQQPQELLVTFIMNGDYIEEGLRDRLFLLSGCRNFGESDGMNGACIDCFYENKDLHFRCRSFEAMMCCHRKMKSQYGDEGKTKL